jgi:uncharacterized LabA/DUF88 family protein
MKPTANIYVDGLNLYSRILDDKQGVKWLDLLLWSQKMLPTHEIKLLRYFTAKVKPNVTDEGAPVRQLVYWRALSTLDPIVTIHEGRMRTDKRWMPAVPRAHYFSDNSMVKYQVRKVEEKGSDVALGSYMIADAVKSPSDISILVSSDSDFVPTLTILREEFDQATGLFCPNESISHALLETKPALVKPIRLSLLRECQFPIQMKDSKGKFTRPESWS